MVTQREIKQQSEKYYVTPAIIDKDWVLGHLLNAFYSFGNLQGFENLEGLKRKKKFYHAKHKTSIRT